MESHSDSKRPHEIPGASMWCPNKILIESNPMVSPGASIWNPKGIHMDHVVPCEFHIQSQLHSLGLHMEALWNPMTSFGISTGSLQHPNELNEVSYTFRGICLESL